MVIRKFDQDGYKLKFQKINAHPIEYYDDDKGELIKQDIYQIAYNKNTGMFKINIVKRSETKGSEIFRKTVNQEELSDILWGLPKELTFGLDGTREEFKMNMEAWNSENIESKVFITDNDALPLYSRGKIDQQDEVINSYVVGKLLPIYEEFGQEFIGEKPYTILFAKPESFAYAFNNDLNISVSFKELKPLFDINKLYLAAMKVFFGKDSKLFQLDYALTNFIRAGIDLNISNLSCIIFDNDLELKFSNLNDFEVDCIKKLLQAFPRIKEELKIEIEDTIIGGNTNNYGVGITDKGIFVVKNQLEHFLFLKQRYLKNETMVQGTFGLSYG